MNISLNFKKQFVPMVESGRKNCTIRMRGKRQARPGDTLYLFTGMRTQQCERIKNVTCKLAVPMDIDTKTGGITQVGPDYVMWSIKELAIADGFATVDEFFAFFRETYGDALHEMILYGWDGQNEPA